MRLIIFYTSLIISSFFIITISAHSEQNNRLEFVPSEIGYDNLETDDYNEASSLLNPDILSLFPPQRKRTSPRYTELTRSIGFNSNRNFRDYERLIKMGLPRSAILSILRARRHPSCFKPLKLCDENYKYRNIKGDCNNVENPYWGSSYVTFRRLLPAEYSDGYNKPKGLPPQKALPNPRLISTTVHPDLVHPDTTFTNMVPQIGQFLDHDFALTIDSDLKCCTSEKGYKDCMPIEIPKNDYFYSNVSEPQSCMDFTRSTAYCFPSESGIRDQLNIDTSYIDASQVYGSETERMKHIRQLEGGRLQMNSDNPNLIVTVDEAREKHKENIEFMGKYMAGDERVNEMPALTVMHTYIDKFIVWVREHNRIADEITSVKPDWDDERIFQEARRIVIAQWQNVIFDQFLPTVLGPATMKKYNLDLGSENSYSDYNPRIDATLFHYFATAAYRFGHTLLNGLIRLVRGATVVGSYRVKDNYFDPTQIERNNSQGYALILGGLMTQNAQTFDRYVTVDVTNFLNREKEHDYGADLIARNIQRSRDHAIPSYNAYRVICKLQPLSSWNQRPNEILQETWAKLRSVYQSPQDIELFPGGISEIPFEGAASGSTFNCLKALQFNNLKYGDRFFFTHQNQAGSFSIKQLEGIRRRTLGDIICENSDIKRTTFNVFRTPSSRNPWRDCNHISRRRIEIKDFLPA